MINNPTITSRSITSTKRVWKTHNNRNWRSLKLSMFELTNSKSNLSWLENMLIQINFSYNLKDVCLLIIGYQIDQSLPISLFQNLHVVSEGCTGCHDNYCHSWRCHHRCCSGCCNRCCHWCCVLSWALVLSLMLSWV